jgi:hypothetical protein
MTQTLFLGFCLGLIIILVVIGLIVASKPTSEQLRIKKLISEGYKFFEYKELFYNPYINTNIISEHSGYFKDENDLRSYVEVGGTKLKWFREYKTGD